MKEIMIKLIRQHQYYEAGRLEKMPEEDIREIYENLIDWLN